MIYNITNLFTLYGFVICVTVQFRIVVPCIKIECPTNRLTTIFLVSMLSMKLIIQLFPGRYRDLRKAGKLLVQAQPGKHPHSDSSSGEGQPAPGEQADEGVPEGVPCQGGTGGERHYQVGGHRPAQQHEDVQDRAAFGK